MGLAFWLYITDFIANVSALFCVTWLVYLAIIGIFGFIWCLSESDETMELMSKFIKTLMSYIWIPLLAIVLSVFVPAQRTMYLMLGSSYLSQTNLPEKVSKVLDLKLDSVIDELNKDKVIKVQVGDGK